MKTIYIASSLDSSNTAMQLGSALEADGMTVLHAYMLPIGRSLSEEITSAIKRCDVFIALIDKLSHNVVFELGYALGTGKTVLLLHSRTADMPFDVAALPAMAFDFSDCYPLSEVVNWVKEATVRTRPAHRQFASAVDQLKYLCEVDSYLDEIEPREFEKCITGVLLEKKFNAELLTARNDLGIDIKITGLPGDNSAVVEVKKLNRSSKVSVNEVQRVVGVAAHANVLCALIITSGGYTSSARFFAEHAPMRIALLTIDELLDSSHDELNALIRG